MNSGRDAKGNFFVNCHECNKGGNGKADLRCCMGGDIRRNVGKGCYGGILIESLRKGDGIYGLP